MSLVCCGVCGQDEYQPKSITSGSAAHPSSSSVFKAEQEQQQQQQQQRIQPTRPTPKGTSSNRRVKQEWVD
jgi:hypothetical protein